MKQVKFDTDRVVDSTENNEYTDGYRDENLVDENLLDTEIPTDDEIPDGVDEDRTEDRPQYNEQGYREGLQ